MSVGDGVAIRSSSSSRPRRSSSVPVGDGVGLAVDFGLADGDGVAVPVAESCGRRTSLEFPVVPAGELFRVWVFTARAADPATKSPAIERTRAVFVFMFQLYESDGKDRCPGNPRVVQDWSCNPPGLRSFALFHVRREHNQICRSWWLKTMKPWHPLSLMD